MAQLRHGFPEFEKRGTVILVIGPENKAAFAKYWREHKLPFIGLPDAGQTVLNLYGQEIILRKFGRMPAQVLVDEAGMVRYVHYGKNMSDIPPNSEILSMIDEIKTG